MAHYKAMFLVTALLLVISFQTRIKLHQVNEFMLSKSEEIMKYANDGATEHAMKQMVGQGQEELAPTNGKEKERLVKRRTKIATEETKGKELKGKGKDGGKGQVEGKGKAKNKGGTGNQGKEKGKSEGKIPYRDVSGLVTVTRPSYLRGKFVGFIYGRNLTAKTLLIKCWKAVEELGGEPVIPLASNSVGARVGDEISFDVEDSVQGEGKPQSIAVNVLIHPRNNGKPRWPYKDASGLLTITPLAFRHAGFGGLIYQEVPTTKTLLIACWRARDEFGVEAVIPLGSNEVGAKVGDKITFDVEHLVQEGEGNPRPMAINLCIHSRGCDKVVSEVPALTDECNQILYYVSDGCLRTDKFFQDSLATSKGGWISTDTFLGCERMKQLGATTKSIIKCLKDAPGVETRDTPGQEAIRRKRHHFLHWNGTVAVPTVAKQSTVVPLLAKKIYTKEMIALWGEIAMERTIAEMAEQDQEELAEATGPEMDEPERAPAVAQAEGPEAPEEQMDWDHWLNKAANKMAATRKDDTPAKINPVDDFAMKKMVGQDQEDIAEGAGPVTDEEGRRRLGTGRGVRGRRTGKEARGQGRMPAVTEADGPEADGPEADGPEADGPEADGPKADGPEASDEQKHWPTRVKQAAKEWAADADARHAREKARAKAKTAAKDKRADWPARAKSFVEKKKAAKKVAGDKARAEKAAAGTGAAEKALAEAGKADAEKPAAEETAAFAKRSLPRNAEEAMQVAAEKAVERAEAGPAAETAKEENEAQNQVIEDKPERDAPTRYDEEKKVGERGTDDTKEQHHELQKQKGTNYRKAESERQAAESISNGSGRGSESRS